MATKSKKLSAKADSKTSTVSLRKKSKQKEKLSSTSDPFPVGQPSNDIDNANVTLHEVEYQRLCAIESNVRDLFKAGDKQNLYLGLGRSDTLPNTRDSQEGPKVSTLRLLVDMQ